MSTAAATRTVSYEDAVTILAYLDSKRRLSRKDKVLKAYLTGIVSQHAAAAIVAPFAADEL